MFSPDELTAVGVSLQVAAIASLIALAIGGPIGLVLARSRGRGAGGVLVELAAHLPVITPPIVVGLALLLTLGVESPLGAFLDERFGVRLAFSTLGAGIAAGIVAAPFAARSAGLAFQAVDAGLIEAAHAAGLSPVRAFWRVTLPLAAPGLVAGVLTAFAVALGEFGAVITFAANIPGETQTVPLAIFAALQAPGGEVKALRLAGISVAMATAAIILAATLRARLEARLAA
jgi:molybdate transport system permease protein